MVAGATVEAPMQGSGTAPLFFNAADGSRPQRQTFPYGAWMYALPFIA